MARKKASPADGVSGFSPLTADDIRNQTDDGSFSRGKAYERQGRIHHTVLRDATIEGLCDGSESTPYHVWATLARPGQSGINPRDYSCNCPRGGFCKHVVALLLSWVHKPEQFVTRASVADQLASTSREDLVALVQRMIQRYPDLELLVELAVSTGQDSPLLDEVTIRRQMRTAIKGIDLWEWDSPREVEKAWRPFLDLAQSHASAGHWVNAQKVFTVLIDEAREALLSSQDENGDIMGLIIDSDEGLSAALDAQADLPEQERLPPADRARLIRTLYDIWHLDVFEFGGMDLSQHGADAIARNVTDEEREIVLGWLHNEPTDDDTFSSDWRERACGGFISMILDEAGLDNDQLLEAFRTEELWSAAAALLLEMDEVDKAVETARLHIKEATSLVAFANDLLHRHPGEAGRAIALVDDLLWETEGKLPGNDALMETWLRDQFSQHNRPQDALKMAQRQFDWRPTVEGFREVQKMANLPGQPEGTWDNLRPKLETVFRERNNLHALIDVYMEEGDIRAALDTYLKQDLNRLRSYSTSSWGAESQELTFAKAAEADYPDDAVAIYRELAEQMIRNRQRASYKIAAKHLSRIRETLKRHDRLPEWQTIIEEIRTEYPTLRALREELDALKL